MEMVFLRLLAALLTGPLAGNLPLDVAPPTALIGISLVALVVLFALVVGVIALAVFVIRAIKKNQASKDRS